jgi:hypothetical protein
LDEPIIFLKGNIQIGKPIIYPKATHVDWQTNLYPQAAQDWRTNHSEATRIGASRSFSRGNTRLANQSIPRQQGSVQADRFPEAT